MRRRNFVSKALPKQRDVLNFNVVKQLKTFSLKFPLCSSNLQNLIQTSLLVFLLPLRIPGASGVVLVKKLSSNFGAHRNNLYLAEVLIIIFFHVLEVENGNFVLESVNIDNVKPQCKQT